ncbi:MAG: E3 binding domain-containing protein, partial [Flavobacteriaceae bacterium]|nr:E3 binding domain-containing protein [Candidatus Onthonaster equi]
MNKIELTIPRLGESVTEVTLSKWNVKVGDFVALDETIAEVSTDKVDSEVPSTHSGIIKELKFEEGDIIPVGEMFAILELNEDPKTETSTEDVSLQPTEIIPEDKISKPSKFLSPLVKKIIKEENLAVDEILKIDGSGHNGRISKNDVLNYIKNPSQQKIEEVKVVSTSSSTGNSEIIEMDKMRQLISKH